MTLHPVILCGGSGRRLWPLSREKFPKQFLPLAGERTLLQDTVARVAGPGFAPPLLLANEEHRFIVAEQMRTLDVAPRAIVLEPVGRGTAAAACVAAHAVQADDPDGLVLVLPSDHVIQDPQAFAAALETGRKAAAEGALVIFGIPPVGPETGYGYVRAGAAHATIGGCALLDRFVEKPDRATAEACLAEGGYAWNSGIFLFKASAYLAELERLAPQVAAAASAAWTASTRDADFVRLKAAAFEACPAVSVDTAVMEHTRRGVVVPVSMGWSDVGAWSALWTLGDKDPAGNVARGDVVLHDARDCYVRSEDGVLAAVVGVDDLVVVVTDDAVLVSMRDRADDVRMVVEGLARDGRCEHRTHTTVHRPWGSFRHIAHGAGFQIKDITLRPSASISLQLHHHRAEHWIVIAGTARVTRDEESFLLAENESTCIAPGTVHRLENPGRMPLRLIEVQSGRYLGEDDIVRLEDGQGRRDGQPRRPAMLARNHA